MLTSFPADRTGGHSGINAASDIALAADFAASRILVVDDSVTVRRTITTYLRNQGFANVMEAVNGQIALEIIEHAEPDLVITDIAMPEMDGLELCRAIKSNERFAQIPVLIQTGTESADRRAEAFSHGAQDLITKPINLREMMGRVQVHLEQRHLVRRLSDYRQSMAEQLEMAREMQESLLPSGGDIRIFEAVFPVAIASTYKASSGLGGDLWGCSATDDDNLRFFMADFTGHGVLAALNTFRFHAFLRNEPLDALPEADAMACLNSFLKDVLPVGQFATFLSSRINFRENWVEICSASGPPPMLRSGSDGEFEPLASDGLPLGILIESDYCARRYPFPPGSILVLYSDALIETPLPPDAVFTIDGLCRHLNGLGASATAGDVMRDLVACLAPHAPEDDLTLLVIQHREQAA